MTDGDQTEKKLIDAAKELLKNKGFDNATTFEIAKAAGVSEMTLFRKFKNKEHLREAAYDAPSPYDYFYYDFVILQKALSLREDVLNGTNPATATGYIYFLEFCIGKLIKNVEEAPYNEHIFEIVNWGRFDISNQEIQHLKTNSHSFKIVYELNDIRALLSGIRRKKITPEIGETIRNALDKVEKLNEEINSDIWKLYKAKKRAWVDVATERLMVFHWFMVTYVYEPPRLFFSTMTNEAARGFKPEPQYLIGFKFCIEHIMNWLTEDKYHDDIREGLAELNALENIHYFYSRMHGTVFKDVGMVRVFDVARLKWKVESLLESKKIIYPYQLNLVFRGRGIKVISVVEDDFGIRSDRDAVQRLFMDTLFGGIAQGVPKIELVLFEEFIRHNKDWDRYYSYALYLPMHGMIGDASSWLIFPRLDGTSNWESWDEIKRRVEMIANEWKGRILLKKYMVEPRVLKNYLDNKDWSTALKRDAETRMNSSKGLLGEFLGYFYLWKKYGAKLVDFDKELGGLEVDVVGEDDKTRYILQAKTSLASNRNRMGTELEEIIAKLNKMEKNYSILGKSTKKILFVVDWDWNMDKALEVEDWDAYIANTAVLASAYLRRANVELVIYKDLRITEKGYEGFLKKIKNVFNIFDEDDIR